MKDEVPSTPTVKTDSEGGTDPNNTPQFYDATNMQIVPYTPQALAVRIADMKESSDEELKTPTESQALEKIKQEIIKLPSIRYDLKLEETEIDKERMEVKVPYHVTYDYNVFQDFYKRQREEFMLNNEPVADQSETQIELYSPNKVEKSCWNLEPIAVGHDESQPSLMIDMEASGLSMIQSSDLSISDPPSKYEPADLKRQLSEISEESPLYNILDTGRLKKKFRDIVKIGQGGFGEVFKAINHVDQKLYAIKVVRLHILKSKSIDPMTEIYKHRVYRELQAASRITSDNIVRYFNSWIEELDKQEKLQEIQYRTEFLRALN